MQKAGIPHTSQSVEELFNLVDIDGSGIMEWSEFETFVANEIQEGRDFMEGEFVLPSGAGIQFAAMVDVLRRKSRVQAVMKVRIPVSEKVKTSIVIIIIIMQYHSIITL